MKKSLFFLVLLTTNSSYTLAKNACEDFLIFSEFKAVITQAENKDLNYRLDQPFDETTGSVVISELLETLSRHPDPNDLDFEDRLIAQDENLTLLEILADDIYQNLFGILEKMDNENSYATDLLLKNKLSDLMIRSLTPREERVIRLRFFYNQTLEEIAQQYNLTRDRIRQIEVKALQKLSRKLTIMISHHDSLYGRMMIRKYASAQAPKPREIKMRIGNIILE